ncbi:MAG TPA: hypothetical protein DEP35_15505 [Deltaproteobacteria bacterium]|nr:hypothetical protein [Deltaproteobacteria bacterium]
MLLMGPRSVTGRLPGTIFTACGASEVLSGLNRLNEGSIGLDRLEIHRGGPGIIVGGFCIGCLVMDNHLERRRASHLDRYCAHAFPHGRCQDAGSEG